MNAGIDDWLNPPPPKPNIYFIRMFRARVSMPHYEVVCRNCKKHFSKILLLVDYEEEELLCPRCASKQDEQCWSVCTALTWKKSA